jgi:acyl-coenzyme A thioesterase PaaI-like protein
VESTSVQPLPSVSFRFTVKQGMCNFTNNLHGGCASTLIDALTTVLVLAVSQPGFYSAGGVSRNLRVTYFRAIPRGADVRLTCSLIHAANSFVLLRGEAFKVDTGELCFVGENEKVNTDSRLAAKL